MRPSRIETARLPFCTKLLTLSVSMSELLSLLLPPRQLEMLFYVVRISFCFHHMKIIGPTSLLAFSRLLQAALVTITPFTFLLMHHIVRLIL
jgi:hypothetical protein